MSHHDNYKKPGTQLQYSRLYSNQVDSNITKVTDKNGESQVMIFVTNTGDLSYVKTCLCTFIVVGQLDMPFAQIYNMVETRREHTDRGGFLSPVERCRIILSERDSVKEKEM